MSFVAREYLEVRAEDATRGSSSDLAAAEDRSFLRRHWPAALASGGLLGAAALLAPAWVGSSQRPVVSRTDQPFLGLAGEGPSGAAPPSNSFIVPLPPDVPDAGTPVQDAAGGGGGGACSTPDQNCWITRCCADAAHKCFMKDKDWAGCSETCEPGVHMTDPDFARTPWNCYFVPESGDAVPPETTQPPAPEPEPEHAVAPVANTADGKYPTLFCYQIIRVDSYELNVVKKQRELGASVFGCEGSAVLADEGADLGGGVSAIAMGDLSTGSGKETHFANTDIFTRAFDLLKEKGEILKHDFTVKVDPDAVFMPALLKDRIKAVRSEGEGGGNMYFLNCHFQDKDWMFGAIEVLSLDALNAYYNGRDSVCRNALDYNNMGEDTFLARCLDHLGVQAVADYSLLADGYCSEAPGQCNSGQVTYHPFKDPGSWEVCFKSAMAAR